MPAIAEKPYKRFPPEAEPPWWLWVIALIIFVLLVVGALGKL